MESQRLGRRLGDALEAQVEHRSALDGEPRLEAFRLVGQPLAAERRLPEPAQPLRIDGVEDEVLQIHAPTVGPGTRRLGACPGQMNSSWAPLVLSMKSLALMMPSTPS